MDRFSTLFPVEAVVEAPESAPVDMDNGGDGNYAYCVVA